MAINLSNLSPQIKSKRRRKRIGRGNASGHGTYSGRGLKGQRSRSGGKKGLKIRGLRATWKRLPKMKGFKSLSLKMEVVNLGELEKRFTLLNSRKANLTRLKKDNIIGPEELLKMGLIKDKRQGVKILARGQLKRKLTIRANSFSKKAIKAIEKVGGKAIIIKT
ncbi:50S ribosomal protein L15 [Patescibacteria group bacterium]|nr:50S ribosomal protein L15 [Patescibacteria group bacterium]